MNIYKTPFLIATPGFVVFLLSISFFTQAAETNSIIALWDSVQPPPVVELQSVKVIPEETAFLILDIEELTCNEERRPRCIESVPKIKDFLVKAREHGLLIVYSLTPKGTFETILEPVIPLEDEPVVNSSVDKFFNTDLEQILSTNNIKTVIIIGTTAEGAVLHTATGASMRGLQVIVPIEGMSAGTLYAEQYAAWHLLNAPGTRRNTILTSFDMIEF